MSLATVPLSLDAPPDREALPAPVRDFLARARERIEAFVAGRPAHPLPAFVPSDFEAAFRALRAIARGGLAPGPHLCEWGSGFGAVATASSWLGYRACGIEIEPDLVTQARSLAAAAGRDVPFAAGTFLPAGEDSLADDDGDFAWLAQGGADGYAALDVTPEDFDVIYAFPWPGGEPVLERIFDACAAEGALLVLYRGLEGIRVQRRVGTT